MYVLLCVEYGFTNILEILCVKGNVGRPGPPGPTGPQGEGIQGPKVSFLYVLYIQSFIFVYERVKRHFIGADMFHK